MTEKTFLEKYPEFTDYRYCDDIVEKQGIYIESDVEEIINKHFVRRTDIEKIGESHYRQWKREVKDAIKRCNINSESKTDFIYQFQKELGLEDVRE